MPWIILFLPAGTSLAQTAHDPKQWEAQIREFEAQDHKSPPPPNSILFLGSSSILKWDLKKYFPNLPTVNRGFGGSHIEDSLYYFDRLVLPCRPQAIVFYAGDNDIQAGKTPERVIADFKVLLAQVHEKLPGVHLLFISIKPSLARWNRVQKMRVVNEWVKEKAEDDPILEYVDIDAPMLGPDSRPRADLFMEDGFHLNEKGYALWTSVLRKFLH